MHRLRRGEGSVHVCVRACVRVVERGRERGGGGGDTNTDKCICIQQRFYGKPSV